MAVLLSTTLCSFYLLVLSSTGQTQLIREGEKVRIHTRENKGRLCKEGYSVSGFLSPHGWSSSRETYNSGASVLRMLFCDLSRHTNQQSPPYDFLMYMKQIVHKDLNLNKGVRCSGNKGFLCLGKHWAYIKRQISPFLHIMRQILAFLRSKRLLYSDRFRSKPSPYPNPALN